MKKYFNKDLFLSFLIIPFLKPISFQYISSLHSIDKLLDIWKLVSIGIIFISYILSWKITKSIILIILLELSIVLSSFINNADLIKSTTNLLTVVGFSMLVELAIRTNLNKFIKVILMIQIPLFIINLVLIILYPNGLVFADLYTKNNINPLYFLTIDNGFSKWILSFIGFIFIEHGYFKTGKRLKLILLWILTLFTIITIDSASCLFIFIMFTLILLICNLLKVNKIPVTAVSLVYIIVFTMVVIFGSLNGIMGIVTTMLGRSSTLTGRTSLWILAINLIKKKPLIGYGYTSGNIKIWGGYFSSHNAILELLIHGGLISLIIFIVLMIRTVRNMKHSYGYFQKIIFTIVFLYFLIFLVETGMNIYFFAFIILANNCNINIEKYNFIKSDQYTNKNIELFNVYN